VFAGWQALKVVDGIVSGVAVPVVNVATARDSPERSGPSIPMKLAAAARKISFVRPQAVKAAIEILREQVKDDWISVFGLRCSADFHPHSVMNK